MTRYGLSLQDIDTAVRSGSLNLSAGSILTASEQIQIRTYEKKREIPELKICPLRLAIQDGFSSLRTYAISAAAGPKTPYTPGPTARMP